MPDTKITALTAITTVDPAVDVLPIVDVSDTTMAASGTTKKITSNQILGAGGTATLASATITGAATIGTTLGVTGVSTFAAGTALLPGLTTTGDTNTGIYNPAADTWAVTTGGVERFRADSSGRLLVGGSNAFSLTDGTGATFTPKFYSQSTSGAEGVGVLIADGTNQRRIGLFVDQTNGFYGISGNFSSVEPTFVIRSGSSERVRIDTAGNLIWSPASTPPTLATNGQLTVNATSNTNVRFSYRGSDGVTRVGNLTLA